MKPLLFGLAALALVSVAPAQTPPSTANILQDYLKLPIPADDRRGAARGQRLHALRGLESPPDAVAEIRRLLPQVTNAVQRSELVEALRYHPTKESAALLCELLDDPDANVRIEAVRRLSLMARRVDRIGVQRTQRGGEFAPKVDGLVPYLIKAAGDKVEVNRVTALFALADTIDPAAIAEIRHRLADESEEVRFNAACLLTEFQDASGLGEMKKALERFRSPTTSAFIVDLNTGRLLASFERITGKSFGPMPMNPMLASDGRRAEESRRRYQELLEAWAAWWAWEPAGR